MLFRSRVFLQQCHTLWDELHRHDLPGEASLPQEGKMLHEGPHHLAPVNASATPLLRELRRPLGGKPKERLVVQLGLLMFIQAERDAAGDPGRHRPQAVEVAEEGHGRPNAKEPLTKEGEGGENGDQRRVEMKKVNPVMPQDLKKEGG